MSSSEVRLERRAAQRFDFQLPLSIRLINGEREGSGLTQDLSARGAFFYTDFVLEQGANVEVTLVMPSEITLSENMPVRCRGKVLRVTPPSIGNKIGIAVHLENYEYLPETQVVSSTTSGDYGRISALHEHAVQDEARATHLPTSGPRGVAVP